MNKIKNVVDIGVSLARVTEIAALEAFPYIGRGDKIQADQAAVDGMRRMFNAIDFDGTIVIGEGEMDEAPMLYIGERVGTPSADSAAYDIAVDPLDGTEGIAKGKPNTIAVLAVAERGGLLHAPDIYMEKLVVGPRCRGVVSLNQTLSENLHAVAIALHKDITEVTVHILERSRHQSYIDEVRRIGCRIKMFDEGDVAGAIVTCFPKTGIDIMIGTGGAPEGVLAAAAIKCAGGDFQGRLLPANEEQLNRCLAMGVDPSQILTLDDLVPGQDIYFAATGVTDGNLLNGVVHMGHKTMVTNTLIMRNTSGTIRFIEAYHNLAKKRNYFKHIT